MRTDLRTLQTKLCSQGEDKTRENVAGILQICENIDGVTVECSSPLAQHVTSHITSHCWRFDVKTVILFLIFNPSDWDNKKLNCHRETMRQYAN